MDHADFSGPMLREAAGLEMGGGDVPVGMLEGEMQIGILHRELRLRLPTTIVLKFRIEIGVEAKLVVQEFLVAKQWRIGPDRLQKKWFAPTGMGTDQIGHEALLLELFSSTGAALRSDDLGFRLHHQGIDSIGITTLKMILKIFDFSGTLRPLSKELRPKASN